jgi:hypothetical protein
MLQVRDAVVFTRDSLHACCSVFAGVQQALPFVDPLRRRMLLEAVEVLAAHVSAKSPVRAACLRFQGALLAHPEIFYAASGTDAPLVDEADAARWLTVSTFHPHASTVDLIANALFHGHAGMADA